MRPYRRRIIDEALDELLPELPAIALEGAKGVGKTATAKQRARSVFDLERLDEHPLATGDPAELLKAPPPVLLDEWQALPEVWNFVRRAIDEGASPASFLLTGSSSPSGLGTHSGAGRIVDMRMRPMALSERLDEPPSVSLESLVRGDRPTPGGDTKYRLRDYVEEIVRSGFPGIRDYSERARNLQLDAYLSRIVDKDFAELGHIVRRPVALKNWMTAYAAASSTTMSFERIRDAATAGDEKKPTRNSVIPYRDVLERLWVLDPVHAWIPSRNRITQLAQPPKHQMADPALAARLLGAGESILIQGSAVGPDVPRDGNLLGALFESLVTLSVRVYAQHAAAAVRHLRTHRGNHEIDLIVERPDGRVVAIEVKLAQVVRDADVKHLIWLKEQLGDDLVDSVVITTGKYAYRRQDGIAVVPAALLGP